MEYRSRDIRRHQKENTGWGTLRQRDMKNAMKPKKGRPGCINKNIGDTLNMATSSDRHKVKRSLYQRGTLFSPDAWHTRNAEIFGTSHPRGTLAHVGAPQRDRIHWMCQATSSWLHRIILSAPTRQKRWRRRQMRRAGARQRR